jgi:hypothetical protein
LAEPHREQLADAAISLSVAPSCASVVAGSAERHVNLDVTHQLGIPPVKAAYQDLGDEGMMVSS